jgi:hypothetical protein
MKTILIEYCPENSKESPHAVHRYIQKVVRMNQQRIQNGNPGERLTVTLNKVKVAVLELKP